MDLETVIQSEMSQKEKNRYHMLMHICGIQKNGVDNLICKAEIETLVENKCMDNEVEMGGWSELDQDMHIYRYTIDTMYEADHY